MISRRIPIRDVRLAAALGVLDIPIKVQKTLEARHGVKRVVFQMGARSTDGKLDTGRLLKDWKTGRLPADHPFLNMLRGFRARNALLDCQNQGRRLRLTQVPGTDCWHYDQPGDTGLPGLSHPMAAGGVLRLGDLKMAAALAVAGLPLLAIEGGVGRHRYLVPRLGLPRKDRPPVNGQELLAAWRRDVHSLPWDEPFTQAAWGLVSRERLLDAAHGEVSRILLEKPRSVRSALVREDATDAAFDQVKRHFDA